MWKLLSLFLLSKLIPVCELFWLTDLTELSIIVAPVPVAPTGIAGAKSLSGFKNFLKQLMPNNNELIHTMQANAGSTTIIDNSVKSANQNNTTQSLGLDVRNNDGVISRASVLNA